MESDNSDNSSNSSNSKIYRGIEIASNSIKEGFDSIEDFSNININVSDDNNILELIGKKITDNWYKYFTSISKGNKIIKINVYNKNRKELYSGDIVFIPELKKTYRVKIDLLDMIEYNPYFF
jgi:hypothetical protein